MDSRPTWDRTWLDAAAAFARRSKCVNSQVAAVVVSADNRFSWFGYNGPPSGFPAEGPCSNWCPRASQGKGSGTADYSACESIHAEVNALLRADASLMVNGTVYVTRAPCINCARVIANSGAGTVVWNHTGLDDPEREQEVIEYLIDCELEPMPIALDVPSVPVGLSRDPWLHFPKKKSSW